MAKLFEQNAHNHVWGRYKATTRLFREEQKTEVIRQACVGLKQGRHDSEKVIYKIPDGRTKYIQRLCLQCQQTSHTSTSCSSRIPGEHKMRYGVWRPNACRVSFFFFLTPLFLAAKSTFPDYTAEELAKIIWIKEQ